jgi:hypothetical protein
MTTLFKKLSITTLALAVAGGIVVSVGSSEPSTFEGQASGTLGTYSISLTNTLTWSYGSTLSYVEVNKNPVNVEVNFELVTDTANALTFTPTNKLPVTGSAAYSLRLTNIHHIREIRSIQPVFSGGTASVVYENKFNGATGVTSTFSSSTSLTTETVSYTDTTLGSYPDKFVISFDSGTTFTSLIITYDC